MVHASLAIGDDVEERLAWVKPQLALYIGGMGAKGRNFYHNLATRYGYGEVADRIQELYLSGRKREAIDLVPDELVRAMSLVGPRGFIAERLAAFAEAGVTTLLVSPAATDPRRIRALRRGSACAAARLRRSLPRLRKLVCGNLTRRCAIPRSFPEAPVRRSARQPAWPRGGGSGRLPARGVSTGGGGVGRRRSLARRPRRPPGLVRPSSASSASSCSSSASSCLSSGWKGSFVGGSPHRDGSPVAQLIGRRTQQPLIASTIRLASPPRPPSPPAPPTQSPNPPRPLAPVGMAEASPSAGAGVVDVGAGGRRGAAGSARRRDRRQAGWHGGPRARPGRRRGGRRRRGGGGWHPARGRREISKYAAGAAAIRSMTMS